jgi:hypothetical protein
MQKNNFTFSSSVAIESMNDKGEELAKEIEEIICGRIT